MCDGSHLWLLGPASHCRRGADQALDGDWEASQRVSSQAQVALQAYQFLLVFADEDERRELLAPGERAGCRDEPPVGHVPRLYTCLDACSRVDGQAAAARNLIPVG